MQCTSDLVFTAFTQNAEVEHVPSGRWSQLAIGPVVVVYGESIDGDGQRLRFHCLKFLCAGVVPETKEGGGSRVTPTDHTHRSL